MRKRRYRPLNLSAAEVFELYLPARRPPGECWEWQGTVAVVGYGHVTFKGRVKYAHRLSYELAHGVELDRTTQIRHSCDNRRCVNPAHLGVGSFYDNMQDAYDRNRFKHTEQHWNAKLTAADVREIRRLVAEGQYHHKVAERFGVTRSAVTNIVNRKAWRQVI